MKCSECGKNLKDNSDICPNCGNKNLISNFDNSLNNYESFENMNEMSKLKYYLNNRKYINNRNIIIFLILFIGLLSIILATLCYLISTSTYY